MNVDFGYYEEGHLGKPYDIRLLKRIYTYLHPYRKWFFLSILLALITAGIDLSFPYLVKVAIDRYIVRISYPVHLTAYPTHELTGIPYIPLGNKRIGMINGTTFKAVDPRIRYHLIHTGVIKKIPYVSISRDPAVVRFLETIHAGFYKGKRNLFVPYRVLRRLPLSTLIRVRRRNIKGVAGVSLLYLGLLIVGFLLQFLQVIALETMGQRVMQDLRVDLIHHILRLETAFFDRTPVGRIVTRVTNDIENLHDLFTAILVNQFKDFFILIGILAILFKIQFRLALYIVSLLPLVILTSFLFSRWARDVFRDIRTLIGRINATLQETLSGIRIVQIFLQERRFYQHFETINHQTFLANLRQVKIFAIFMPLIELIASLAMALILWRGGVDIMSGALSLGALVAILSYIRMFFRPIRDISEKYNIMQSAMASTERIFQLMDQRPETKGDLQPTISKTSSTGETIEAPEDIFRGNITFSNVSFAYEDEKWVLKNLNITFPAMKTTAIIGATGAGKSSMAALLERFYTPQRGIITIGGMDLTRIPLAKLRENVGLVQQEVQLFSGPLWKNILLGIPDPSPRKALVILERLKVTPFLTRLPEGINTWLKEEGKGISSGERQLVAMARAFARDPRVLILDEATASMDPFTEHLIQRALKTLLHGRTVIVIAHRLSTIRQANYILVLKEGRLVESGTHDALIRLNGLYRYYHDKQSGKWL